MKSRKMMACVLAALTMLCAMCAAAQAEAIGDIAFEVTDNGSLMVTWADEEKAPPYTLTYTTEEDIYNWYEAESYSTRTALLEYLVPGETYAFKIENANGTAGRAQYTVPCVNYSEFASVGRFVSLTRDSCSKSRLAKNDDSTQLRIDWPKLAHTRYYACKAVLVSPVGSQTIILDKEMIMHNKYTYNYVNLSFGQLLNDVEQNFGTAPTGTYRIEVYMDGYFYDDATFTVSE